MIKLGDYEVKATIFPDGTSQVWKLPDSVIKSLPTQNVTITWEFESEAELIHIAQLKDLLVSTGRHNFILHLPFLPYARQDKPISNTTTFALQTFATLLNSLKFIDVGIEDPHSDAFKHIRNSTYLEPTPYITEAYANSGADVICYPDSGAMNRYSSIDRPHFCAYKIRNQLTGEIVQYGFTEPNAEQFAVIPPNIAGKSILIVDDICDGGATFKLCAEKLIEAGAKEVHLYVTHGLFTKGLQTLRDSGIKRIFTRKGEIV